MLVRNWQRDCETYRQQYHETLDELKTAEAKIEAIEAKIGALERSMFANMDAAETLRQIKAMLDGPADPLANSIEMQRREYQRLGATLGTPFGLLFS